MRLPSSRLLVLSLSGLLYGCPQLLDDDFHFSNPLLDPITVHSGGDAGRTDPEETDSGSTNSPDPDPPTFPPPDAAVPPRDLQDATPPVVVPCEGEFQTPVALNIPGVTGSLYGPWQFEDQLFFSMLNGSEENIVTATRSAAGVYSAPIQVLNVNSGGFDGSPALSADGLDLYFFSSRSGGPGGRDLWLASRASASATFSFPTPIENVSSTALEGGPRIRADGLALRFVSTRSGSSDIWQAVRDSPSGDFNAAQSMTDLNTAKREEGVAFSSDDLTVYFTSDRDGNAMDVWRARRDRTDDPFGTAELVTSLSSPADDLDLALSSDDQQLMMASDRNGALRLFQANWACD